MKKALWALILLELFSCTARSQHIREENTQITVEDDSTLPISSFEESWGYLMKDREREWTQSQVVTDLCYFASEINSYGEVVAAPNRKVLEKKGMPNFTGRVHTVSVCQSRALTHFVLSPQYNLREQVIDSLVKTANDFDGLQIDWELIPARDNVNFQTFLRELKSRLQDKMLSVAVHARTRDLKGDAEDYAILNEIADRVFIMAYDEHWSGSKAGSVASMDWCAKIADYALTRLSQEHLVIGLPFYGRSWQDANFSKAWIYSSIKRNLDEAAVEISRKDGVPYFNYSKQVNITCYYEDAKSLALRAAMYKQKGITKIGFWRLGQEDPTFWQYLTVDEIKPNS